MTEKGAALASSALSGGRVDRQGVAPGQRPRRGAVGRGFGCGSGRLGINVHRELETDLCRGPWLEFPGRRHHGAGRPFVALDDPQEPAHQATIASGAEDAVTAVSSSRAFRRWFVSYL